MLNSLVKGNEYTNKEITKIFSCASQGGMRVSRKNKTITIISVLTQRSESNPYKDSMVANDGTFVYTGMGTKGDQVVTKTNQNGKVAFSEELGYKIFYFVSTKPNTYEFMGEAVNNGDYYFENEADVNKQMRRVVKFPLRLI